MKFPNYINIFFINSGIKKIYLTFFSWLCAFVIASYNFNFDFKNGILILITIIFTQLAIQLLDDYIDWILGLTTKRKSLEAIGVRGLFNKCEYILNNKKYPKINFYFSSLFFILAFIIILYLSYYKNYSLLLLLPILLIIFGLFNYLPLTKNVLNCIGTEFICATLCGQIVFISTYYATTNHLSIKTFLISTIFFLLTYYLFITTSFLNLKPDTLTQKSTLPIILKNTNIFFLIYVLTAFLPYLLIIFAIISNTLPKTTYITFLTLPLTIWHIYLMYLLENQPTKKIKWNFLMGCDCNKIENEQKNISWYTVRYNFARNIFILFSILIILSILDFKELFIF